MAHGNTIISPEWCLNVAPAIPELYRDGESIAEVAAILGISRKSYERACKLSPEFEAAHMLGQTYAEAAWAKAGRLGAMGRAPIQAATYCYGMNNRFRENWSNTQEFKQVGDIKIVIDSDDADL